MMSNIPDQIAAPTDDDQRLASLTSQKLELLKAPGDQIRLRVLEDTPGQERSGQDQQVLSIPTSAFRLLNEILKEMAKGNAVTVIPVHTMLSTQQAADILNVSRPFLVGLLESGKIPYQRLGSHRRIRFRDLMIFKESADIVAEKALRELADEAQELGLGY